VNGSGSYAFRITAIDGSPDKFRMEIWNGARDVATAKIYDNQWGDNDPNAELAANTMIGGGSITIKK
jgi:basic membrane lipoprotein Med (substrate-binding protein (PBP1-ABC) superfamily)